MRCSAGMCWLGSKAAAAAPNRGSSPALWSGSDAGSKDVDAHLVRAEVERSVDNVGVEIDVSRPSDRACLLVHADLLEHCWVTQGEKAGVSSRGVTSTSRTSPFANTTRTVFSGRAITATISGAIAGSMAIDRSVRPGADTIILSVA